MTSDESSGRSRAQTEQTAAFNPRWSSAVKTRRSGNKNVETASRRSGRPRSSSGGGGGGVGGWGEGAL